MDIVNLRYSRTSYLGNLSSEFFSIGLCHIQSLTNAHSGDSMENREVLKRGDVQLTSAGTGIRHSEKAHGDKQVHFLQIWALPSKSGLTPQYFTRSVESMTHEFLLYLSVAL